MKKLLILLLVLFIGAAIVYYNYNRKNESLSNTKSTASVTSTQLFSEYESNEAVADKQYIGKVIEVKGKVRDMHKESTGEMVITLDGSEMFGVICRMNSSVSIENTSLQGKEVVIKGLCTGMLMDVVITQCVFVK